MKVVVLDSLFASLEIEEEVGRSHGDSVIAWDGSKEALADADVVAHVRTRIDSDLIAAMPRCRVIARFGTGLDTVDVAAARAAGIEVVGVRDYCLPELASQTLLLAFALSRRLFGTARDREANWESVAERAPIYRRAQAVVVGLGAVGTRVCVALTALGYEVTAVTRSGRRRAEAVGVRTAPLDEALPVGDTVFLHCALSEETRGLIDASRLRLMKPGAILVNTARLGLLDEEAVAAAVEHEVLGGLGLDAAIPAGSPLRRVIDHPNVLVTPHIGWYSEDSAAELRRRTIEDALRAARHVDDLEVSKR